MYTANELLKLQENNMLAVLPCKEGDIFYTISACAQCVYLDKHKCDDYRIIFHENDKTPHCIAIEVMDYYDGYQFDDSLGIDEKQYFTLEAAEQALSILSENMGVPIAQGD